MELKDDPGRLEGHLALQMHGGQDMHVQFKDIEILQKRIRRKGSTYEEKSLVPEEPQEIMSKKGVSFK